MTIAADFIAVKRMRDGMPDARPGEFLELFHAARFRDQRITGSRQRGENIIAEITFSLVISAYIDCFGLYIGAGNGI